MRKFRDWVDRSGLRRSEIARQLAISSGHLSDLIDGRIPYPGRKTAQKIYRLTEGEVTPNDFLWDDDEN
jgi:DNA-binding transcriptional regulator YdaS (Cro superfamily)